MGFGVGQLQLFAENLSRLLNILGQFFFCASFRVHVVTDYGPVTVRQT
jgi:hypothetical protein